MISPNVVRVIKSTKMRWVGHVARMEESRSVYKVLAGKPEEKNHLYDPGKNGGIILRWIFKSGLWGHGLDQSGSGLGQVAGTCECDNEPPMEYAYKGKMISK